MYKGVKGKEGTIFSLNISSDTTGVGSWTNEAFSYAMRTGKGQTLDSSMPWQAHKNISDEDLEAILYVLKRSRPVRHHIINRVPPTWCEFCEREHGLGELNRIPSKKP